MNDELPLDPALQSLEARLSALRPKLPPREAQELLYRCAFAAGERRAARRTRRWQLALTAMAVGLLAAGASLLSVSRREPSTEQPIASSPTPRAGSRIASRGNVPLDAWQIPADTSAAFEAALAKFNRMDASSRALAVGAMDRSAGSLP